MKHKFKFKLIQKAKMLGYTTAGSAEEALSNWKKGNFSGKNNPGEVVAINTASIPRLVLEYKEAHELTWKGLAEVCGVTRMTLHRWLTGENIPTAKAIKRLRKLRVL